MHWYSLRQSFWGSLISVSDVMIFISFYLKQNDPSASEPSVRFQIQAHAKGSKRALPPDVAATIFRCLQEKSVNPDKFKYRKPEVSFGSERRRAPKDESKLSCPKYSCT